MASHRHDDTYAIDEVAALVVYEPLATLVEDAQFDSVKLLRYGDLYARLVRRKVNQAVEHDISSGAGN